LSGVRDSVGPVNDRVETFRAMHASGCFVIPNPWDAGSAVCLERLGFKALSTTSAGQGFTHAKPDHPSALSCDTVLAELREMVEATKLPVNADFQAGYAREPEAVAANVTLCVATGVAGLSIEDATGERGAPVYDRALAVERIRASRKAIDATGIPVVLTARCEAALLGVNDPMSVVLDRLVAYAEAGADCLFAPGLRRPEDIARVVAAVAPKPVNVLVASPTPALSVARLADLGVRRISVGSALARVAWGAFMRAARAIATTGSFEALGDAASFVELNTIFGASE
jgi:2-methylisocitrate lyase-like PEP mutase family enzyme